MTVVNILYSGLGGHFSVVFSLIEADEKNEFNHVLIFYGIEDMPQSYIDKCNEKNIRYYFVKKIQGVDFASKKQVNKILASLNPGVIMLHSIGLVIPLYLYSLGKEVKLICVEHQSNHLKTKKEWLWSALLMLLSTHVVFLTELYASQIKGRLGFLYSPGKVKVINNGIDTSLFQPVLKQTVNNNLGMLARLISTKEHIILVEALRILLDNSPQLTNVKLLIAGDGETRESIVAKVQELNLADHVEFCGMIAEKDTPEYLHNLTIYVHASLGETMSTALMQAMACGKPVIASDVDGINNMIIHEKTGILVPATNKHALAEQLERLLSDKELQDKLGNNALQYARQRFSNQLMFKKYSELFV